MKASKCYCDLCKRWSPIHTKVRGKLSGKLLKDFDHWCLNMATEVMDGDVAQAKLEGSWPGWEWLPTEIEKQNKKTEHLRNATPLTPRR